MSRRVLSLVLLAILAVPLLGGTIAASVCTEPCPDEGETESCPPVCTLCTGCTHAQTAVVTGSASGTPRVAAERLVAAAAERAPSSRTDDIFHVPLPG